tara:strand:+ start:2260 stop:2706 length:447 start_codon:yes stop_codon:yes gene_type:complete
MTIGSNFLESDALLDVIMSREWTLKDVLQMEGTIEGLVQELINNMDFETKYNIVKNASFCREASHTVGEIISIVLREELKDMVSFTVNKYLKDAKVNFIKEPISEIVHKEIVEPVEELPEEKIMTLKERIKLDTKLLSEEDKNKRGMV